ncbi:MAG TPA: CBS domain-containing protein [Solirubrobacter sp.]|nr:CBS domain-containing protein [Solirubrobacter sp.]
MAEVCKNERVTRADAERLRVRDAMVTTPKTTPANASVAELRATFANPHVVTALLVDGPAFAGIVHRDTLAGDVADASPARALAVRDVPTIAPDAPLTEALAGLDERGERRLVVLDGDGSTLRGLLCLTTDRQGFCQS